MSAIRFSVLAIVLVAGLAQADHHMGKSDSCPAPSHAARLYGNSTIACATAVTCQTAYCTCIGANRTAGLTCTMPTTKPTCTAAGKCAATLIDCLNKASDTKNNCTGLKDLHMSLLSLESGSKLYNTSMAYTSCKYRVCKLMNASAGNNCTLNFRDLCVSPISYAGTLLLKGNFTAILASPEATNKFAKALEVDLETALKIIGVWVQRLYALGGTRPTSTLPRSTRRQKSGALVTEFTVPGVNAKNTAFKSNLNTISQDGNWLKSTTAEYSTLTGGQTLTFLGLAEGSGSSAFSEGKLNSLIGQLTPAPPTPNPGTVTTAGAAMQSLLAAVVVAILSAMLF